MISACICLGLSALYHSFFVYSKGALLWLAKLDYAGITILILGSTIPSINYYYACGAAICK
jgi:adiponectin receptor